MDEVTSGYTPEYSSGLLGLHAFCECDSTSAFKGRGHVQPIKTMLKRPSLVNTIDELGNAWNVSENLIKDLNALTCSMYGNVRLTEVDNLRLFKIKINVTTNLLILRESMILPYYDMQEVANRTICCLEASSHCQSRYSFSTRSSWVDARRKWAN